MAQRFARKVALVTGAAKGIGRAVAEAFVREGGSAAGFDFDGDGVRETASIVGDRSLAIEGDVRLEADAGRAVRETVEAFGGLDVLVSNAGVVRYATTHELTEEDWDF